MAGPRRDARTGPQTFLAELPPVAGAALAAAGQPRRYRPGDVLFRQGDVDTQVLVLTDGWVKVASAAPNGRVTVLAVRGPGDLLGELSAVDGRPRSATVTALGPVQARVIAGAEFIRMATSRPPVARALLRHLAGHLRDSDAKRVEFAATDSFRRLAGLLLELADQHGRRGQDGSVELAVDLTRRELAEAGAMSREALMRGLRTLRERDVVRTGRGGVTLVRPSVLRLIAAGDDPARPHGVT